MAYDPRPYKCIGRLTGVNMNSTGDQAIALDAKTAIIRRIMVYNASASLTLAAGGMYTGASKTGTVLVAATQLYTALTAAGKYLDLTLASAAVTDIVTVATVYFSLTTAQGAAATATLLIFGEVLDA